MRLTRMARSPIVLEVLQKSSALSHCRQPDVGIPKKAWPSQRSPPNRPPLHYGFGSGILYCTYINELYCLSTNVIICVRRPRAIADRAGDQSIVALKEQWQKMNGKDKKKTI